MADLTIASTLPLLSGFQIPRLGFGTCASASCTESALWALEKGYIHLDTAQIYQNERETGVALAQSKMDLSKIFVCSKLWEDAPFSRQGALQGVQRSLAKLGVESIDLYLLHTPRPGPAARHAAWLGLQDAVERGLVRSIGVSNWAPKHIERLMGEEGVYITPAVNQVELHPWNQQRQLAEFCRDRKIVVVAYSPLTQGKRLNDATIVELAHKYGKSPAQVVLRWGLQKEIVVIPKSDREQRIEENRGLFGWELEQSDIDEIDALDEGQSANVGEWDPYAWE